MTFAAPRPLDVDAIAVDVAASQVLITSILRALAEKAPDIYAGVVISADAELARAAPDSSDSTRLARSGAVAAILGAVDRCLSTTNWRRAASEVR